MAFPDPNKLYTPAEYLAMEAVAEEKSNYCDGHIFQTMTAPRNEAADRGAKASQYRTVESVQIQVIVAQHLPEVEVFLRMPDECWSVRFLSGLDETIELPLIDVKLSLAEIYQRVRFRVEPYIYA